MATLGIGGGKIYLKQQVSETTENITGQTASLGDYVRSAITLYLTEKLSAGSTPALSRYGYIDDIIRGKDANAASRVSFNTDTVKAGDPRALSRQASSTDIFGTKLAKEIGQTANLFETILSGDPRALQRVLSLLDTTRLGEVLSRFGTIQSSITNTFGMSDSRSFSRGSSVVDSILLAEAKTFGRTASLTEKTLNKDTITSSITQYLANSMVFGDTAARSSNWIYSIEERLLASETLSTFGSILRIFTDTLIAKEQMSGGRGVQISETARILESLLNARSVPLSDSLRAGQTELTSDIGQTILDRILTKDSISYISIATLNLFETLLLRDTATKAGDRVEFLGDILGLSESLLHSRSASLLDRFYAPDPIIGSRNLSLLDKLLIKETLSQQRGVAVTDILKATDQLTGSSILMLVDKLNLGESLGLSRNQILGDTIRFKEPALTAIRSLSIIDALRFSEDVTSPGITDLIKNIWDNILTAESISKSGTINYPLSDLISIYDYATRQGGHIDFGLGDSILSNAALTELRTGITIVETVKLGQALSLAVAKNVTDTLSMRDLQAAARQAGLQDSILLASPVIADRTISILDKLKTNEALAVGRLVNLTESLVAAETLLSNRTLSITDFLSLYASASYPIYVDIVDGFGISGDDADYIITLGALLAISLLMQTGAISLEASDGLDFDLTLQA